MSTRDWPTITWAGVHTRHHADRGTFMSSLSSPDEPTALRFERYLKSGSGRAFAKRHFEP